MTPCLGFVVLLLLPLVARGDDYSDLQGPYCSTRRTGCCPNRMDDCSVPILGTLCYCDDFCNRTRSEDCCPDFWTHCKGMAPAPQPVKTCYHNGRYLKQRETTTINCNKCTCQDMGGRLEVVCERNECLIDPDIISGVNARRDVGWRAGNFSAFWGRRLDEGISLRLGTLQPHKTVMRMNPVHRRYDPSQLPRNFDARTEWRDFIQGIKDQGWCGSSWAISTAAVGSDRFAIMSRGTEKVELSAQHLLACNNRGQRGCQGGYLDRAWFFLRKFGVVDEDCYRYQAAGGDPGQCRLPKKSNLLTARCAVSQTSLAPARTDLYRVGPAYRLGSEQDIMDEIRESGPVQATMKVYQDFFMYQGGVYRQSGLAVSHRSGYHSVRIVGWGEDSSIYGHQNKFWLVANSWGQLWGEQGYFRILRGSNECNIEEFVLASWADTTTPPREQISPNNNRLSNRI